MDSWPPTSLVVTGPASLAKEELIGNQLWLIVQTPKFSPSPSHPGGIVNLRAVFNKTKATWNYMQVWFSTVHIYLIPKVCGSVSDQLALLALSPPGSQQFKFQTNSLFSLFLFTGLAGDGLACRPQIPLSIALVTG